MRGLLSLLTLTATLVCLVSLPDATQSRSVYRQRHPQLHDSSLKLSTHRARRDSSPEMPKHRARRDTSPEMPKYRFTQDEPSITPELRNKRDTSSVPVTKTPYSSMAAKDHYRHGNHDRTRHNSDTQIPHGGHDTAREHRHRHLSEDTNGITTTHAAAQHNQGHHGQHRHTEGTVQQGNAESFTQQDDFELTAESVRSHVKSFLENMTPQQIENFLVSLDNIEADQVFKDGETVIIPSGDVKAHINVVFDALEEANDSQAEEALRVMLHYLHGFEYSEFHKLQGSYGEEPTLEFARGFALGMVDRLAEQGEEEIQTSLAEMQHLLNTFEERFSINPLHSEHKRRRHHGDGPPATFETVTALVNKVFGELENNADKSERDHELKIIAKILHSLTRHSGYQREHLETDEEGRFTLESVKKHALKLVNNLHSHKQSQALADLANVLEYFEARASDTQPAVHFEAELHDEFPVSSHNANANPAAAMKYVDEFVERYVVMNDDAQLTTLLRGIVAYFVEFEREEKQWHHNVNNLQQKDDDDNGSEDEAEAEVSSDIPEGNTRNEPNTNLPMFHHPTIGTRSQGGFAAAPENTGVGSGIPGRGGAVRSHNALHVPTHTVGHRAFRKRR